MPWINKAKVLVQLFYSGMFSGQAVAEFLLGKINPSGKLPITFPVSLNESPDHKLGEFPGDDVVNYKEGIYVGYRYYEKYSVKTLFPFGFGLSYTTFEYSNLMIDGLKVMVNVKNSGNVKGSEIIQLYIKNLATNEDRPIKELKAFTKVNLEPGEQSTETFNLQKENFAYFSLKKNKWVTDSGTYQIIIGDSVENALLDSIITI